MSKGRERSERKVVSRGVVLVDPRKAIEKLREYLLPDPTMYLVELVRAAVAGKASFISIDYDANELELTFDGEAIHADELARLLDHLFSAPGRRLRLMALAVNTALGLDPSHVDLYTPKHNGDAKQMMRVRWTTSSLNTEEGSDGISKGIPAELVPPPAGMPPNAMRVHVRERLGFSVFKKFFARESEELRHVRERLIAQRVPIKVNGVLLENPERTRALVEVPVPASEAFGGTLSLVPLGTECNRLEFSELGLLLDRRSLYAMVGVADWPLRLSLDAEELPTNASRSQVNLEGGFGRELERACTAALRALANELRSKLEVENPPAELVAVFSELLLAACPHPWSQVVVRKETPAWIEPLLDLRLVPKAIGTFLSLREVAHLGQWPVHTGDALLPREYEPWLGDVLWVPGGKSPLYRLLSALPLVDAKQHIAQAQEFRTKEVVFLTQKAGPPRVPGTMNDVVVMASFGQAERDGTQVPNGLDLPEGIAGEIVVRSAGLSPGHSLVGIAFIKGRALPAEKFGSFPVALGVAVESPALRPRSTFEGPMHDKELEAALGQGVSLASEALAFVAAFLADPKSIPAEDPRMHWIGPAAAKTGEEGAAALLRAVLLLRAMNRSGKARGVQLRKLVDQEYKALAKVRAWPRADGGAPLSTEEVRALATKCGGVLLVVAPNERAIHPGKIPVLMLNEAMQEVVAALLTTAVRWCDYEGYERGAKKVPREQLATEEERALRQGSWLRIDGELVRAAVAFCPRSICVLGHRGRRVSGEVWGVELGSVFVCLEDNGLIPSAPNTAVRAEQLSPEAKQVLLGAEYDLLSAYALCALGDAEAAQLLNEPAGGIPRGTERHRMLEGALAYSKRPKDDEQGFRYRGTNARLVQLLRSAPLIERLTAKGSVGESIDELAKHAKNKERLGFVTSVPAGIDFDTFTPLLIGSLASARVIEQLAKVSLTNMDSQLPRLREESKRRRARAELMKRPVLPDRTMPVEGIEPLVLVDRGTEGVLLMVLPAPKIRVPRLRVLLAGRLAFERTDRKETSDYPVFLQLNFPDDSYFDAELADLTDEGWQHFAELLRRCSRDLLSKLLERAQAGIDPEDAGRLFIAAVLRAAGTGRNLGKLREQLANEPLWKSQRGTLATATSCARVGKGRVLYVNEAFPGWLPPVAVGETDVDAALLPTGEAGKLLEEALMTLAGTTTKDATKELKELQRQRKVAQRGVLHIKPPGSVLDEKLSVRLESAEPGLGVGELRLTAGTAGRVFVYINAEFAFESSVESTVGFDVAIESALLGEEAKGKPLPNAVVSRFRAVSMRLVANAASRPGGPPTWLLGGVRTFLLGRKTYDVNSAALKLFDDAEGKKHSIQEIDAEIARYGNVFYTTAAPSEELQLSGRMVLVLSAREAELLKQHRSAEDCTEALQDEVEARKVLRMRPAARIEVRESVPDVRARRALEVARDGYEGEVVLLPAARTQKVSVHFWRERRPLGKRETTGLWPAMVAIEAPKLEPNRAHSAPKENDALERSMQDVRNLVRSVLSRVLGPESGVDAVDVSDRRGPASVKNGSKAVGYLWLAEDPFAPASVTVTSPEGVVTSIGADISMGSSTVASVPVEGRVWLQHIAGDSIEQVELVKQLLRWAYPLLLEKQFDRVASRVESFDERLWGLLICAAAKGVPVTERTEKLFRAAKVPDSSSTLEELRTLLRSGGSLLLLEPGERSEQSVPVLVKSGKAWCRWLMACRYAVPRMVEEKETPKISAEKKTTAVPEKGKEVPRAAASAATPAKEAPKESKKTISEDERFAQDLLRILQRSGVSEDWIAAVELRPNSGREPTEYRANARLLIVDAQDASVIALRSEDRLRALGTLAAAALSTLDRARTDVTKEMQLQMLGALLSILRGA